MFKINLHYQCLTLEIKQIVSIYLNIFSRY